MDKVNEEKEKKEEIFKNKKSPHSFTYKIYLKKKERKSYRTKNKIMNDLIPN